jgi:hypothetical protein
MNPLMKIRNRTLMVFMLALYFLEMTILLLHVLLTTTSSQAAAHFLETAEAHESPPAELGGSIDEGVCDGLLTDIALLRGRTNPVLIFSHIFLLIYTTE